MKNIIQTITLILSQLLHLPGTVCRAVRPPQPKLLSRVIVATAMVVLLLLSGCNLQRGNDAAQAPEASPQTPSMPRFEGAPVALPLQKADANRPLPEVRIPGSLQPQREGVQTQALPQNQVALRILVIGPTPEDPGLQAWRALLDQLGANYEVLIAATQDLTPTMLEDSSGGRFQAILLASNNLAYEALPGFFESAFSGDEWLRLWDYQRRYAVRSVSLYTFPGPGTPNTRAADPEDYCIRSVRPAGDEGVRTDNPATNPPGDPPEFPPVQMTLTPEGRGVFSYLNPNAEIPIQNAYLYPARLAEPEESPGCLVQPLLQDSSGNVLGVFSRSSDGRERIALTFASNPYLLHTQLLGYGLVRWATRGLFIGERRHILAVDVDDWGLESDWWDDALQPGDPLRYRPQPFRLSAQDAWSVYQQQRQLNASYPLSNGFMLNLAFNGRGVNLGVAASCNPGVSSGDPLSSLTKCLASRMRWVNHTRDHPSMDNITDPAALRFQIAENTRLANQMGLWYSTKTLKTGELSGLGWYRSPAPAPLVPPTLPSECPAVSGSIGPGSDEPRKDFGLVCANQALLDRAVELGIRYFHGNYSVGSHKPPCPICGVALRPSLLMIPVWPTNIAYTVTTPAEATSFYNYIYAPGGRFPYWPRALTYQEILEQETNLALYHLQVSASSHYFHQANLREYEPGRSLVFDYLNRLMQKYTSYYNIPVLNPSWDEIGDYVAERTNHTNLLQAGITATWNRATNEVTFTAPADRSGVLFFTGAAQGVSQVYGGDTISKINLSAGQTWHFSYTPQPE